MTPLLNKNFSSPHAESTGVTLLAILYFFFNSFFLPQGLLYTAILTPYFLWWLYTRRELKWLGYFFLFTIPFIPVQLYYGMELWDYARSYVMFFTAAVFGISVFVFLKNGNAVQIIFRRILFINFIFMIIALFFLPFPLLKKTLWFLNEFSPGTGTLPRLKMLSYEASYYALLIAPVAIYFYLRIILYKNNRPLLIFLMVTLPLLLSLSVGVIAGILLAFIILFSAYPRDFLRNSFNIKYLILGSALFISCAVFFIINFPHNPIAFRIINIFTGNDSSFRARTYESFILAWNIVKHKSVIFGCGPGQAKLLGVQVFKDYYGYLPPVVRIPNTLADTLATYGILGLFIRLMLTIYFFFKTRVAHNYYRLGLFIFMFIYQFTGSFLTNIAEYFIWILAFTQGFREFDKELFIKKIEIFHKGLIIKEEYVSQ